MNARRAAPVALVLVASLAIVAVVVLQPRAPGGSPPPAGSPALAGTGSPPSISSGDAGASGPESSGTSPLPSLTEDAVDTEEAIDARLPVRSTSRIELYPAGPSVAPGEPVLLNVSTAAASYGFVVDRLDATLPAGFERVATASGRPGHDRRSLATFDPATRTARANWPVTDTVATDGWQPGVYVVTAADSSGTRGQAIFVVRTPVLAADRPAFVFTALTYQAYNSWGGANLYSYNGVRAVRVSFDRPYQLDGGKGYWTRDDDRILRWLQLHRLAIQYTTDYDLAVDPPATAPRLLILPRHAEYVPGSLRDWVEQHVDVAGDMNVLSLGANGFYWQVRLARPPNGGPTLDVVCWKEASQDPMAAVDPSKVTVRWREAPLLRPEGALVGAQYSGVVGDGFQRRDFVVTAGMPPELIAGTGWSAGTILHGLLLGETDALFAGSGATAILDGRAADRSGVPFASQATVRTSPAGARVFDASTFAWADGFAPPATDIGVSAASFERFNLNLLAWLGFPVAAAGSAGQVAG